MKKIFTIFLALTMAVGLLAGCGKKNAAEKGESDSNKLSVVTTIFPEYDWVKEILGDKAESTDLTMLLSSGVDLHSYQPTADDIVKISDCDLFVYVGGESDGWVESVLKNAADKKRKVINLLEVLGDSVKTEETVEGMQEAEHAHDHSKEVSTFEDHEVQDRSLSDWEGSWQSAYVWHTSILSGSRRAAITAQSLSESFSQKVGLTARNSYVPLSYSRCSSLECRTHCSTAESFANMCATPVPRAYVKMQRTAQCIGDCHNSRQGGA